MVHGVNAWKYWRPIYKYTWAIWQGSSYSHFTKYLNGLNNVNVVDIGSGAGEYLRGVLPNPNLGLIITDPDMNSLQLAIKNSSHLNGAVSHKCCSVDIALASCSKPDIISYVHVLSVIENPDRYILESKKVLAEDGIILVYLSKFNGVLALDFISKFFGFRQLQVKKVLAGFERQSVGLLNYCYYYRAN